MSQPRFVALLAILALVACSKAPPPDEAAPAGSPESAATDAPAPAPPAGTETAATPPSGEPVPGAAPVARTVENTHWRLVEVAGQAVAAPGERPEPHIVLFSDEKQAQGFGGCNRMRGPYEADGETLKFGPLASTKMACDYPGNPEDAFMQALSVTRRARVSGNQLELYDEAGSLLAKFEARVQQ